MNNCPNCRARNPGTEQCRRCGMELKGLLAVQAAADRLTRRALRQLAQGQADSAQNSLRQSQTLRQDPFIELLLGFAREQADKQET